MQNIEFIDISKKEYIESVLGSILKGLSSLQIWQKEEPLRHRTDGFLKSLNVVSNHIELESKNSDGFIDFEKDEIFFYSSYRTTVFKSKIIKRAKGNKILIEFPEVLKIREARVDPRTRYGLNSNHRLDIMIVSEDGRKNVLKDIRIIDSSNNGAAILIPLRYKDYIVKGCKIIVLDCSLLHLEKRAGLVRSVQQFKNSLSGERSFRLGLELMTF